MVATGPAWAFVVTEAVPEADWCARSAWTLSSETPVYEESATPPVTESDRCAATARVLSPAGSELASGKFWTLMATYVAMDIPPAVTYSTRRYLLPTRGNPGWARQSVTESMTFVDPFQTNVATIASPWCGFVGLKPLINLRPLSPSVPLT